MFIFSHHINCKQVTAFYNYWLGFATIFSFFWEDECDPTDFSRKAKRDMEEKNKKARKRPRTEFNESVRKLAAFVKKRDKRVLEMRIRRGAEMEKKREEEKQRKKELDRQKAERLMSYEEPKWAKIEEVEEEDHDINEDGEKEKINELYCVVCCKKFKSYKQWENHEQSKRHKEKLADLRYASRDENIAYEVTDGYHREADEEKFVDRKDEVCDIENNSETSGLDAESGSDMDETSVLEAMLSGCKKRMKMASEVKAPAEKGHVEIDSDELDFLEYNDMKNSHKNRGGRPRGGGTKEKETGATKADDVAERNDEGEEHNGNKNEGGGSRLPILYQSLMRRGILTMQQYRVKKIHGKTLKRKIEEEERKRLPSQRLRLEEQIMKVRNTMGVMVRLGGRVPIFCRSLRPNGKLMTPP